MQIILMRNYLLLLIITISLLLIFKYGRSIYMPIIKKFKGRESIESIMQKIEANVSKRLENNLTKDDVGLIFPSTITLVAFKEEQKLLVYSIDSNGANLIKEYPFTGNSGKLGPKLQEGDKQIPEGIYKVEYLNPNSNYYLSIKINYPNEFDKSKTKLPSFNEMGGDVFIHGKASTIGCIPIGDEAIEEVFFLTQKALNNVVKVIISPRDFRVNSTFPLIENIDWENELYGMIEKELQLLK